MTLKMFTSYFSASFWSVIVRSSSSKSDQFYPASHGSFSHTPPSLYNPFIEDAFLRHYLAYKLPNDVSRREREREESTVKCNMIS